MTPHIMIGAFSILIGFAGIFFGIFGGVALVIWTSTQAGIARIKAERGLQKAASQPQVSALIAEIKALQLQMDQMQSTSHQFDISFDEALNRLESRVSRLETRSAVSATQTTEESTILRNGQGQ